MGTFNFYLAMSTQSVAEKLNEEIDEWNKWPNHGHIDHLTVKECMKEAGGGRLYLSITEHELI